MSAPSKRAAEAFFRERLAPRGHAEAAAAQKAYMKSDLAFFGVAQRDIRGAVAEFTRAHEDESLDELRPALDHLFASKSFDLRSCAIAVLERRKAALSPSDLPWLVEQVRHTACWAHVDWLASLIGHVLARHPAHKGRLLPRLARDESFWVQRAALIAQNAEFRRGLGDFELFCAIAAPLLPEKEFCLRKAIGWALRDASMKRPDEVHAFVAANRASISALSRREALRKIGEGWDSAPSVRRSGKRPTRRRGDTLAPE